MRADGLGARGGEVRDGWVLGIGSLSNQATVLFGGQVACLILRGNLNNLIEEIQATGMATGSFWFSLKPKDIDIHLEKLPVVRSDLDPLVCTCEL